MILPNKKSGSKLFLLVFFTNHLSWQNCRIMLKQACLSNHIFSHFSNIFIRLVFTILLLQGHNTLPYEYNPYYISYISIPL